MNLRPIQLFDTDSSEAGVSEDGKFREDLLQLIRGVFSTEVSAHNKRS